MKAKNNKSFNYYIVWFCFILLNFVNSLYSQPYGYSYGKSLTISSSIVTGTNNLVDFPILFHISDLDLRSISNGGNVSNTNGYDIIFTESTCSSILNHQIEKYDPVTGELVCWVKLPVFNYSVNTVINVYFGNPTVVIPTSSPNTWSTDYSSVLHLSDSPVNVAPQMVDGSGNLNSGTCLGSMTGTNSTNGKIAGGILFDEIDDGISLSDFDYTQSFTISFWFKLNEVNGTSFQYLFSHGNFGTFNSCNTYFGESSLAYIPDQQMLKTIFQDSNDATSTSGLDAGTSFVDGNWHYYAIVVGNLGGATVYVDGIQIAYIGFLGGNTYNPATSIYWGCRSDLNSTRYLGGMLDECRILNVPRSAEWIETEFNNQSNAASNFTLGATTTASILCSILPIELISFSGYSDGDKNILKWTTATEFNNDYFEIQHSVDAINFISFNKVKGAGISTAKNNYSCLDNDPIQDITYYRLKQFDFDGRSSYSSIISVANKNTNSQIKVFPNPFSEIVAVEFDEINMEIDSKIKICNELGQVVKLISVKGKKTEYIDLSNLPDGVYLLDITNYSNTKFKLVKYAK